MHGMDHLAWYKNLTTLELINMAIRLTKEVNSKPDSVAAWKEIEDLQAEVDYRQGNLRK